MVTEPYHCYYDWLQLPSSPLHSTPLAFIKIPIFNPTTNLTKSQSPPSPTQSITTTPVPPSPPFTLLTPSPASPVLTPPLSK
ncbi:predicted protein [Plenodomus lingam JN3]|uniref:Predicted protein n=1 Tax=Leptosphaeria maculans (strain JN3 / isolate v23.1.3 / race Av1-4-5-6-7-8) TaxID=985895 RepID=E4ZLP1_LEPMJ|nr:predicted protein [Plenodomus lingam JN3]CBX92721.1 predicted protein [Plenodomus lingam JN3]